MRQKPAALASPARHLSPARLAVRCAWFDRPFLPVLPTTPFSSGRGLFRQVVLSLEGWLHIRVSDLLIHRLSHVLARKSDPLLSIIVAMLMRGSAAAFTRPS